MCDGDSCKTGPRGAAFTLIELLVVVGVIGLLLAVLLPSLAAARESSRSAVCGSNLRQAGISLSMYSQASRGWLPPAADYRDAFSMHKNWFRHPDLMRCLGYEENPRGFTVITCPSHVNPSENLYRLAPDLDFKISYGMNVGFGSGRENAQERRRLSEFSQPTRTMALMDAQPYANAIGEVGWHGCLRFCDAYRHREGAQAVYLDGHIGVVNGLIHGCAGEEIDFIFWGCYWMDPLWIP